MAFLLVLLFHFSSRFHSAPESVRQSALPLPPSTAFLTSYPDRPESIPPDIRFCLTFTLIPAAISKDQNVMSLVQIRDQPFLKIQVPF